LSSVICRTPVDESLNTAFEDTARQPDATLAPPAADADIGAEPDHLPLVAAAGMLLFETDYVSESNVGDHQRLPQLAGEVLVNLVAQRGSRLPRSRAEVLAGRGVEHLP